MPRSTFSSLNSIFRKSRCKLDGDSPTCVMCRVHGTECTFPSLEKSDATEARPNKRPRRSKAAEPETSMPTSCHDRQYMPPMVSSTAKVTSAQASTSVPSPETAHRSPQYHTQAYSRGDSSTEAPLTEAISNAGDAVEHSDHIIGPTNTCDARILGRYLSGLPQASTRTWLDRLCSNIRNPVLFTSDRKRPSGMTMARSQSRHQCQIIEKLVDPCADELIDL